MDKPEAQSQNTPDDQVPALQADLIKPFLDQHFAELDQDRKDGFITKKELTQGLLSHKLQGNDAKAAEAILENFHALEQQSKDEWGTENNGITRKDAAAFDQHRKLASNKELVGKIEKSLNADEHDADKFISLVNIYKPNMDDDKSGTLGASELKHYIEANKDRPAAIGAAKLLLDHFDAVNELGSTHAYKTFLTGDKNPHAISANELATFAQVLGPEKTFRDQLGRAVDHDSAGAGSEWGKQGRMVAGRGDSAEAAVIGIAMELIGGIVASHAQETARSRYETLLDDFQQRKAMVESWKFFK